MGFSKKLQVDGGKESEGTKWVFAEIAICAPLNSISTKPKEGNNAYHSESDEDRGGSTTPTSRDSRIPERLPCPPAPRKRRPASSCRYNGAREFFDPPDLESVFIRHVERAN